MTQNDSAPEDDTMKFMESRKTRVFILLGMVFLCTAAMFGMGLVTGAYYMNAHWENRVEAIRWAEYDANVGLPRDFENLPEGFYVVRLVVTQHGAGYNEAVVARTTPTADVTFLVKNVPPEYLRPGQEIQLVADNRGRAGR